MWFVNEEHLKVDRELFVLSESIADEQCFSIFIESLKERYFSRSNRALILNFFEFFEGESRRFQSARIQSKLDDLLRALKVLKDFSAAHFFVFPKNQDGAEIRHSLHPDYFELEMNSGSIEEHRFYLEIEKKLLSHAEHLEECYRSFRKIAEKALKVK
jgi:hypothetical protein